MRSPVTPELSRFGRYLATAKSSGRVRAQPRASLSKRLSERLRNLYPNPSWWGITTKRKIPDESLQLRPARRPSSPEESDLVTSQRAFHHQRGTVTLPGRYGVARHLVDEAVQVRET